MCKNEINSGCNICKHIKDNTKKDNTVSMAYTDGKNIFTGKKFETLDCMQKFFVFEHEKAHNSIKGFEHSEIPVDIKALEEMRKKGVTKRELYKAIKILDNPRTIRRYSKCKELISRM